MSRATLVFGLIVLYGLSAVAANGISAAAAITNSARMVMDRNAIVRRFDWPCRFITPPDP
jgi:hypothetical protein